MFRQSIMETIPSHATTVRIAGNTNHRRRNDANLMAAPGFFWGGGH